MIQVIIHGVITIKKKWCWDYDVQLKDELQMIQGKDGNWYEIKSCIGFQEGTDKTCNNYKLEVGNEKHYDITAQAFRFDNVTNCRQ